jgi:glycosyltransferase involved in cell wall biosynthesis
MAQALLGYLLQPGWMAEQGRQARQMAEQRYSIQAMAEAYAAVYEQTLGRRQAA